MVNQVGLENSMQGMNGKTMLQLTAWTNSHMIYHVDLNTLRIRGDGPNNKYSISDWRIVCRD